MNSDTNDTSSQPAADVGETASKPAQKPRGSTAWIWVIIALVVAAILFFWRHRSAGESSQAASTPIVAVATVAREDLSIDYKIDAEFRPYAEVELNAKVSGYLTNISVDFGDKVKAGQVLAVLEIPELKDELDTARAVEQRAEADFTNAHLIYTRLVGVNKDSPNSIAPQDIDNAEARDSVAAAAVTAAKADVQKYQTLFGYTGITAPFDGVVTGRYADPGALIQAGTASTEQSKALLRVSDNYRLRIDFPVSVEYVRFIKLGDTVEIKVDSLGDKTFSGKITRFTGKVTSDTRTMITEVEVANPNLEIVPGMYAIADLKLERRSNVLTIPTEAISSGDKTTIFVVDPDNKIEERAVTLGLETPTRYEVASGIKEGERVMIGSRTQVAAGEAVQTKPWQPPVLP